MQFVNFDEIDALVETIAIETFGTYDLATPAAAAPSNASRNCEIDHIRRISKARHTPNRPMTKYRRALLRTSET